MNVRQFAMQVCIVIFISLFMVSCAPTTKTGHLRSSSCSYEKIFKASIRAVSEINFSVTSSDMDAGLIVAEQPVTGSDQKARMNITVKKVSSGTEVNLTIQLPPGVVGDTKGMFNKYADTLKRTCPDVEVVSFQ